MMLYRYRFLNDKTYNSVSDNYFWLSSPDTFNDPFDCHLKDDYFTFESISDENDWSNIHQSYYDTVIYPSYLNNGIACFAESHEEILLWSHYADCHRGVCLGFDFSRLSKEFMDIVFKVNYTEAYPQIHYSEFLKSGLQNSYNYIFKALATKYKVWQYEKEWRMIIPGYNNKKMAYPEQLLSRVYLGCNINSQDKETILSIIGCKSQKPEVFQCEMAKKAFALEYKRIL